MKVVKEIKIYRNVYRLPSEAFIESQAESINNFDVEIWTREILPNTTQREKPIRALIKKNKINNILFTFFAYFSDEEKKPSLIHAHFGPDAALIYPFAKRNHIPLIVTCHGFDVLRSRWDLLKTKKISNILYLLREKELFKYAKYVIAVSAYIKMKLIERGCPEEKIITHYIGVDVDSFQYSELQYRGKNTIAHVGRHVEWKGVDILLYALAQIKKSIPDVHLYQIGAGPETPKLQQLANSLGLSSNITWFGAKPHDFVKQILSKSMVYAHPSRFDSSGQTEAFGIALIEAQAIGLPVVATGLGGIPEAMQSGVTGFSIPENDHNLFAQAIVNLMCNENLYYAMSEAARNFVLNNFNIAAQSTKLEGIYERAINCNQG